MQRAAAVHSGGDLRRIAMPLVLERLFSCGVAMFLKVFVTGDVSGLQPSSPFHPAT
jgi:hypothetical protein